MKAEELLSIGRIFEQKGWPLSDKEGQFPLLFETFARMLARLSAPERAIVLELTRGYVWLTPEAYKRVLLAAWDQLAASLHKEEKTVVMAPLVEIDAERPTSADHLLQLARGFQDNLERRLPDRTLWIFKSTEMFAKNFEGQANTVLVLLDDYVGSGDTASRTLQKFWGKWPSLQRNRIYILALAAQRAAVTRLTAGVVRVQAGILLERGISDHPTLAGAPGAPLQVMAQLGKRLKSKKGELFGYGNTEATATLLRTPNNTFPVYWTNRSVGGTVWDAPFPRRTNRVKPA
jgi:hypothetical protein